MNLPSLLLANLWVMVTLSTTPAAAAAVEYRAFDNATGTPGGTRFENEIKLNYSERVLSDSATFIWSIFHQSSNTRKSVQRVNLFIESMDGVAYTSGDETHVSADYIAGYSGDVKTEFTGVLYHEQTHVWQWDGQGTANGGLIEGIADYVRLKAGLAPNHWVKPGQGDSWDQGYDVTARFLDYLDDINEGFVAIINGKMKNGYSDGFFVDILGKTVDQLWKEYKARHGVDF